MRRLRPMRLLGIALAALVAFSIGARPTLKAQPPLAPIAASFVGGALGGAAQEHGDSNPPVYLPSPPMTIAETKTRLKLHDRIPMNFSTDTPLEDVVRYIEKATADKADFPEGISIYVDPQGLQDADKTMASTLVLTLKNLPLETTLGLMLKQLGLTSWVNKDGLLIITNESDELVTPATLDREILKNLTSLREEVRALRGEVFALRRGAPAVQPGNSPTNPAQPNGSVGGMGGGFR